jgi:hypothetical protein
MIRRSGLPTFRSVSIAPGNAGSCLPLTSQRCSCLEIKRLKLPHAQPQVQLFSCMWCKAITKFSKAKTIGSML